MRRNKSIIVRGALCAAVLFGSASLASACGNVLMYALLFRAYSEAGRAHDAERAARRTGELSAAVWSADLGLSYHQWSLKRTRKVLDRLATRVHRAALAERVDLTVSIVLADEVYVAQLHTKSRNVGLKPLLLGHPKNKINLYTTANALRVLINGRMSWPEVVKRDLVVLAGPSHQQERVISLLSSTFSGSALGD